MIYDFPTSDPLHLLELGIMKKCILRWVYGEKGFDRKWSKALTELASRLLLNCSHQMPCDFHRKPKNFDNIRKWKGVEFRQLLLYLGIVIFKRVLDEKDYNNFKILFCAVQICSCNLYKMYQPLADKMFKVYVKNYSLLYGEHTVGSNVHNLTHIVEDLEHHDVGNLMEISTYKYENCLRLIGLKLKHTNLPLEQIARRIIEDSQLTHHDDNSKNDTMEKNKPIVSYQTHFSRKEYKKIEICSNVILSSRNSSDCWFLTDSKEIVKMKYVFVHVQDNIHEFKIAGQVVKEKGPFFATPIDSAKLNIFMSDQNVADDISIYSLRSIYAKMICLPYDKNTNAYMPLLHTIESLRIFHNEN